MDFHPANLMSLNAKLSEDRFNVPSEIIPELNQKIHLNDSFEKESELSEDNYRFLVANRIPALSHIDCHVANSILKKHKLPIRKETCNKLRHVISTTLQLQMASITNKQTIVIFKDEQKALKYFEYAKNQTDNFGKEFYFSCLKGMILNDKKALKTTLEFIFLGYLAL